VEEGPAVQTPEQPPVSYEPFGFFVLPGVPGPAAERTVYNLSLNLLVGSAYGIKGAQLGTVMNITEDRLTGVQASGVFNTATKVSGAQVGVVNISQEVSGAQVGIVNIASGAVRGAQVGIVNISRDLYGIPIGLINIVENGIFRTTGFFSERGLGYLGFQMGSRYLYTLFYGGMALGDRSSLYTAALGFGLHIPVGPFFVDADLSAKASWTGWSESELDQAFDTSTVSPVWPSARLLLGVEVFGFLGLLGGVMFDTTIPGSTVATELHQGSGDFTMDLWGASLQVYPKLFAGIKF
jgi:hypothetical protein